MDIIEIVGVIAGGILILCAVAVFWSKKEFPLGGIAVTLVAFVLIGMSQWTSIKISAAGATVEALKEAVKQTAIAADEVAAQAEQAAAGVQATQKQIENLSSLLESRRVLGSEAVRQIKTELKAAPDVDLNKMRIARESLGQVIRRANG
jgi:hypothetical protein